MELGDFKKAEDLFAEAIRLVPEDKPAPDGEGLAKDAIKAKLELARRKAAEGSRKK